MYLPTILKIAAVRTVRCSLIGVPCPRICRLYSISAFRVGRRSRRLFRLTMLIFLQSVFYKPRLHDSTCCQTGLTTAKMFVYTIQLVVKRLYRVQKHQFDKRLYIVYTAGCQTGLNEQWLFVQHGCQTRLTTGWQPVGCLFTRYNRTLSDRLYNRFDNRVEWTAVRSTRVCQTGCTNRFDNRSYRVNGV